GVLTSSVHRLWADRYGATMKEDLTYSVADCFNTFPLPGSLGISKNPSEDAMSLNSDSLTVATTELVEWRRERMLSQGNGYTALYSRFHDAAAADRTSIALRERHVALDAATTAAYGWDDLELGHGFHDTRYGT